MSIATSDTIAERVTPGPAAVDGLGAIPGWLLFLWVLAAVATTGLAFADGLEHAMVAAAVGVVLIVPGRVIVHRYVRAERTFAIDLFTGAFLARYVFAAVVVGAMALGDGRLAGGGDYLNYDRVGWMQAEAWRSGDLTLMLPPGDPGYFYLVALIYTVTGRFLMAPTLMSALCGALAAVATFTLGRRLFGSRVGVIAGILAAFLPTLLFWSSLLYKDVILSLLTVVIVYLVVDLRERFSPSRAVLLGGLFAPLFVLRTDVAIAFALFLGGVLFLTLQGIVRKAVAVGLAGVLLAGLIALMQQAGLTGDTIALLDDPLGRIEGRADQFGARFGGMGAEAGLSQALYGANLLTNPHLLLVALIMPFVVPIPGTSPLGMNFATFLLPGQLIWLALLPALAVGSVVIIRQRHTMGLVLLLLCAIVAFAVALSGYFSNPRYLVQVVPLMLIVTALGMPLLLTRWRLYLSGVFSVLAVFLMYGLIR